MTAHRIRLGLLPVILLFLAGASYVGGVLMIFDARLKPGATRRVEDSSGRPAFPVADVNGIYAEEREICSGPQDGQGPMRTCTTVAVPSAECPRCIDGYCQSRTGFSLSVPGEYWRFVGFPGFRCADSAAACVRLLEQTPGQVEFDASPERITAKVVLLGPSGSVRLCARARYYPPWSLEEWNRERIKGGLPPYPSTREIFLGRLPEFRESLSDEHATPSSAAPPDKP